MYGSNHQGSWRHDANTCKSCTSVWQLADFTPRVQRIAPAYRATPRDDTIGRDVIVRSGYGYNNAGGGRFRVTNVRGQVWSQADPTMIGSRRERAYWIADGSHYYAAAASDLIDSCGFEVPSMVTGGQTDVPCVGAPVAFSEGVAVCADCLEAVS